MKLEASCTHGWYIGFVLVYLTFEHHLSELQNRDASNYNKHYVKYLKVFQQKQNYSQAHQQQCSS